MAPENQKNNTCDLAGRQVVVVGLARTGQAVADFLLSRGAKVVGTDTMLLENAEHPLKTLAEKGMSLELGGHKENTFLNADMIVVSPGVPLTIPPLKKAMAQGVDIIGELELAAGFITAPMVAVTGTNGKSTVTTLIGEILKASGKEVFVGGNLGNPLVNLVRDRKTVDLAVVEVSSFQLETVRNFHPKVAVLLNITPDHLDRHAGFKAYVDAKARMFSRQVPEDTAVLNADDKSADSIQTRARRLKFSRMNRVRDGAFIKRDKMVIVREDREVREWPLEEITLVGTHNQENIMAAILAGWALGLELDQAFKTAAAFKGLAHRLQFVGQIKGVSFFNDSKGTNPGAVIKSLESFTKPVLLIAGGRDKATDFSVLKDAVREKVKLAILIGEAREKIARAIEDESEIVQAENISEAVRLAMKRAEPGEVVLLSPACASFDQFRDYIHRGEVFTELVQRKAGHA
ncbi:MAG: UDP-N-acetylmuramoyl-L-alanine--D-glutamate ligase [Candidatus Adiutricales bacterium]